MPTLQIAVADPMSPEDKTFAEHREVLLRHVAETVFPGDIRFEVDIRQSVDEPLAPLLEGADFLIAIEEPLGAADFDYATKVQLVHKLGMKCDMMDIHAAKARSIPVAVSPHFGCVLVAEHTLCLMLALVRRLVEGHNVVLHAENPHSLPSIYTTRWKRYFNWMGYPPDHFRGLYGKKIGIVGMGEIGTEVARRAKAFSMQILYIKRNRLPKEEEANLGVEHANLETIMRESDFVSIHAHFSPQTEKMVGKAQIALMKPDAYLINTARGNIVDQEALVDALREGRIAGAGLDVFSNEPPQPDDSLLRLQNVVFSPHVAARGSIIGRYLPALDNFARVARGEPPLHIV